MKKLFTFPYALFLVFVLGQLSSCKQDDPTPPCKLAAIDRGNDNKHAYTYDANGKISQMSRDFDGGGSGNIDKYIYSFTYDSAGLLTKTTWTLNGQADGSETYTYTNGKISKVTFAYASGDKGTNNIKYDASGRMTEFSIESGDPNADGKQYFEYDVNGIMTKRGFADLEGNKFFEVITKPVGLAKSPEVLLANNGLTHDVLTGMPWQIAEGGVGTSNEVFYADNDGKWVSDGTSKTTAIKTNTKGYLTESTSLDDATKQSSTQRFTMLDCD